jgi:hypothetical protein
MAHEILRDMEGNKLCTGVYIVPSHECIKCKEEFRGCDMVWALGSPYYCLVHRHCLHTFDFNKGYPHPYPQQDYFKHWKH